MARPLPPSDQPPGPPLAPPPATSRLLAERACVSHGFDPAGPGARELWRPEQVHGATVVAVRGAGEPRVPADAAVSTDPARVAAVVTADCIPILLAGPGGTAVAAVHAGWRGLAAGVVEAAVRAVVEEAARARGEGAASARGEAALRAPGEAGLAPADLVAAIGPGAGGCCYEVGPEVLAALEPPPSRLSPTRSGHARLDLRGLAYDRLIAAGVRADAIDATFPCTICSKDWPSYRRDGTHAGRLCAFIAPAASR